ncbi:UDP-glucose dehydrogenase [Minicystis rosea]|nr:UDP-glucose dehydrogenase [Minicystis rosea]
MVGTGYVGLVAGAGFADFGNDVACVDVDEAKISRLQRGEVPIYEPGLGALIAANTRAGRLRFSTDVAGAIRGADVVLIAVGTPPAPDGSADLSAVYAVARLIGERANGAKVVATKSTVPVGTADRIKAIISGLTKERVSVASNPEFLKEGNAINDFMKPDRVVIGSDSPRAWEVLRQLYAPFVRATDRIHLMDARSAELTKYAANALLATRISFMNDLALLAEKLGADIELVRKGMGADPRIGSKFLFPGPGFGGSCFPKDIAALLHTGDQVGHDLGVVRASALVNARQKRVLGQKVQRHFGDSLAGRTVAVWGLAFKPQTDDVRESPALVLIDDLLAANANVQAHDPEAMPNVKVLYGDRISFADEMYGAAHGADALILVTEWHPYRTPDFLRLKKIMKQAVLFDGRNTWLPSEVRALGFSYVGIGRS